MKKEPRKIPVEVEFTEGYQDRFTQAILKIYSNRLRKENSREQESGSSSAQDQQMYVS